MIYIVNYVYCVIDCLEQKSFGAIGLRGEEVFTIPCEDVSAVVSRIHPDPLLGNFVAPTEANWLKHDEVVRSLVSLHTVIPVKFGSVLKSDRDLKMMLRRLLPECRTELKYFKDKVEVGVKILSRDENLTLQASKEKSGIDQFRKALLRTRNLMIRGRRMSVREAVERHLDSLHSGGDPELVAARSFYADRFHAVLSESAKEARANPLLMPEVILNGSFLIDRSRTEAFMHKVYELRLAYPSFEFLSSGPWAPYNFTRIKYY